MKRVTKLSILLVAMVLLFAGCATNEHIVGAGPQGAETVSAQQWYVLWGLVPINEVDTNEMAGGAEDYLITTEYDVLDVIINFFTNIATVQVRSVDVSK
ncbi:MAG: Bor/Iss family lipoprotein [Spirochaetaceae bacterium]